MSVDSPQRNSAMVEKLSLPFPMLSDPDRSTMIEPVGVADPNDDRQISRPAMILFDPDGEERWRFVSRDFADRLPEDQPLAEARALGLDPTTQDQPVTVDPESGPRAMPLDGLPFYLRGARFAALAMGMRHRDLGDEIKEDSKAYVAEMDLMLAAVKELRDRRKG